MIIFPNISPSQSRFSFKTATFESTSPFSFQTQSFDFGGWAWNFQFSYPPLKKENVILFREFFTNVRGSTGLFLMGDPAFPIPQGTVSESDILVVNSTLNQRDTEVSISGFTPSTVGVLLAGDYIQIGINNNSRLYSSLSDVDSDLFGIATVTIQPATLSANVGDSIIAFDAKGVFKLSQQLQGVITRTGDFSSFSLEGFSYS